MKQMLNKIRKRKYISMVLLSVILMAIIVAGSLLYVVNATDNSIVIKNSVTLGNRTFTKENPLTIIEIVPDKTLGTWGYLSGLDNGAVKWSDVVSLPRSNDKNDHRREDLIYKWLNCYVKFIFNYDNDDYYEGMIQYKLSGSDKWVNLGLGKNKSYKQLEKFDSNTVIKFNYKDAYNNNYGSQYNLSFDIYDRKFVDENGNLVLNKDGNEVNDNILALSIFMDMNNRSSDSNYYMCDKLNVVTKAPDELTVDDIENADAVVFSEGYNVSNFAGEVYNLMYNYARTSGDQSLMNKYPSVNGVTVENGNYNNIYFDNNYYMGKDLSPAVAGKICERYVQSELSIMSGVNTGNVNIDTQPNFKKVYTFISAIDRDTCYEQLCENEIESGVYEGKYGRVDFNTLDIQIFTDSTKNNVIDVPYKDYYDSNNNKFYAGWCYSNYMVFGYYLDKWPNSGYPSGENKMYGTEMYLVNDNLLIWGAGNNPFYNGFISNKTDTKVDGVSTSSRSNISDAINLYGTKKDSDRDSIYNSKLIQYVFGGFRQYVKNIKVLEIQPSNDFKYDTFKEAKELMKYFKNCSKRSTMNESNYKEYIDVTSVSVSELNGMTDNIANKYDLVIIGDEHSENLLKIKGSIKQNNGETVDSYYYSQGALMDIYDLNNKKIDDSTTVSSGNDLTDKSLEKIEEYMDLGKPIILASSIYNAKTDYVEIDKRKISTNVYKIRNYNNSNMTEEKDSISESDKIEYKFKPVIKNVIADNEIDILNGTFSIKFKTDDLSGTYNVEFYIDKDANGVFVNSHDDTGELYAGGFEDTNPKVYGYNNGFITVTTSTLPKDLRPYLPWKLVIKDTKTGLTSEVTGTININLSENEKTNVKVLQIMPNTNSISLQLNNKKFMDLFNAKSDVTKLMINKKDVTIVRADTFDSWYEKSNYKAGVSLNSSSDLLKDYTIVVLGFADEFSNITNEHALANLRDYMESGKSVLMTHDTIGLFTYTDENSKDSNIEKLFAGDEYDLRYAAPIMTNNKKWGGYRFSTAFRNIAGMDMYHVTVGNGREGISYQQGYSNNFLNRFGVLSGVKKYEDEKNYLYKYSYRKKRDISPVTTNKVNKLNDGQITSYPYEIPDSLNVAETHGQYYQLDLEKQDDTASSIDSGDDVVVWYTLGQGDVNYSESNYFSVTGQDAANNYYIYSKGNITYSGAGHSNISGDDELKLFVNTIIWAINSGNNAPQITIENAVKTEDGIYEMYSLDGSIPDIQFVASDIDMGSDTSALMSSGVFYWDKDKDGNYTKNNADKDVVIQTFDKVTEGFNGGYNIYNGISEKLISARFNKSGGYTRLASLVYKSATASSDTNVNLASESTQIYKDMCNKLADKGVVYLGIQVSDSKGGTGKAVIRVVRRDLFKLN